jgi:hypothetical protein
LREARSSILALIRNNRVTKPLAIDLFCGWTEALLAEGYDVIGFDIERHEYGEHSYPVQLVIQDEAWRPTPEDRYMKMREWVESQIAAPTC